MTGSDGARHAWRELIAPDREMIRRIAEKHGARNLRVFGSAARGEAGPNSDVDLPLDPGAWTIAWFPSGLAVDVEEPPGRRVAV